MSSTLYYTYCFGGLLLFLYGIGNGLPVMLVGTAAGGVLKRLDCSRFGNSIDPIVGGLLILLGFYLLWRIGKARAGKNARAKSVDRSVKENAC